MLLLTSQKAFDTVDHKILLSKLEIYGIKGNMSKRFENNLTNRKQYIQIDKEAKTALEDITYGVPQGLGLESPKD